MIEADGRRFEKPTHFKELWLPCPGIVNRRLGSDHHDIAESLPKCHDIAISGARPAFEV
jgi:hypothetical protein